MSRLFLSDRSREKSLKGEFRWSICDIPKKEKEIYSSGNNFRVLSFILGHARLCEISLLLVLSQTYEKTIRNTEENLTYTLLRPA